MWPSRAVPPALEAAEAHVWAVSLEVASDVRAVLFELLADNERVRAQRLVVESARTRFIAAHGALRLLLAAYVGVPPRQLTFCIAARGKPYLGRADTAWLRFNLAHSDALAVVAVARNIELGVDIERRRILPNASELAARYFAPDQARALNALPIDAQSDAFLHSWTSKEAALKLTGEGLSRSLNSVRNPLGLHELAPGPDYVGALIVQASDCRLRCFSLGLEELLATSRRGRTGLQS